MIIGLFLNSCSINIGSLTINDNRLMTLFIKTIFGYENFFDYNYLFRMIDGDNELIIDIYDNVSDNRFNRYIFSFNDVDYDYKVIEDCNVFVNYIGVLNISDCDNKLLKLGYLFKIDFDKMIEYARLFIPLEIVEILEYVLKKPI